MSDPLPVASRKKKVHYHDLQGCKVGKRALVWPIDHPDVPVGAYAQTSIVQSFDPLTGVAETVHTRYEPGLFGQWSDVVEDIRLLNGYQPAVGPTMFSRLHINPRGISK
jgi:hypothetical protein